MGFILLHFSFNLLFRGCLHHSAVFAIFECAFGFVYTPNDTSTPTHISTRLMRSLRLPGQEPSSQEVLFRA
jgi:hypothetical protein